MWSLASSSAIAHRGSRVDSIAKATIALHLLDIDLTLHQCLPSMCIRNNLQPQQPMTRLYHIATVSLFLRFILILRRFAGQSLAKESGHDITLGPALHLTLRQSPRYLYKELPDVAILATGSGLLLLHEIMQYHSLTAVAPVPNASFKVDIGLRPLI